MEDSEADVVARPVATVALLAPEVTFSLGVAEAQNTVQSAHRWLIAGGRGGFGASSFGPPDTVQGEFPRKSRQSGEC